MVIDSHAHVMLPSSLQIEKLDEAQIDRTVLFSTIPYVERAEAPTLDAIQREMSVLQRLLSGEYPPQKRLERMKTAIHELKAAIAFAPDRFYGFGPVPLGLSQLETSAWIEQEVIGNSFRGLGEFTPGSAGQMAQLETVFQALADFPELSVWVHTFHPVDWDGLRVLLDLCRKYPKVPVIFGHLGGVHWMEVIQFAKEYTNAYLDLSAVYAPLAAKTAITEVPDRCLFSPDAPFGTPELSRRLVEWASPSAQIADLVLGENIAQLLKI